MRYLAALLLAAAQATTVQAPCSLGGAPCPGYEGWKPQVGHCYRVTATETFQEIGCPLGGVPKEWSGDCTTIPNACGGGVPFDVPPKEVDEEKKLTRYFDWPDGKDPVISDGPYSPQFKTCEFTLTHNYNGIIPPCTFTKKVHHRTCTDKSRFLLMSEDGKWHCLDFGRLHDGEARFTQP